MPATSLPAAAMAAITNPLGGSTKTKAAGAPQSHALPSVRAKLGGKPFVVADS